MENLKLFMLLLGCTPKGRHIEQHDIFFGIATELKNLVPEIIMFWPEAEEKIHIDAWREVTCVDGYKVAITEKIKTQQAPNSIESKKLFFINLGGYKENEFEEYHYRMLCISNDKGAAIQQAKQTAFYAHTGFKTAESHIDDKFGIDVDDLYEIEDILPQGTKEKYAIKISHSEDATTDELHMGYFRLNKL